MKCELCCDNDCLDLPSLTEIKGKCYYAFEGDGGHNRKTIINGHESYDNTLIMKSKLKWNEMWIVLWWWLFRSSLTLYNSGKLLWWYSQKYGTCDIGKYDLIWFDLIWFDLIRHSKSHWKQHSLWKIFILLHCRFASNKYFSIPFPFSRFRCSCSRKSHSRKVEDFNRKKRKILLFHFLRNPSLSLAERRKRKSSLSLSKSLFVFLCCLSVICLITVKITIQPIQSRGSFIQFKKYEK